MEKKLLRPIRTLILKRYMTLRLGMIPVRPDWKKHKLLKNIAVTILPLILSPKAMFCCHFNPPHTLMT